MTARRRLRRSVVEAMKRFASLAFVALCLGSCSGSTGGGLLKIHASAAGAPGADATGRLSFDSPRGYRVVLTRAILRVGAVYLNRSGQLGTPNDAHCALPGIYVAEVLVGADIDALSSKPQPFPVLGEATLDRASVGEVWLNGGDVNAADDPTIILDVAGTATRGASSSVDRAPAAAGDAPSFPFEARLTIGKNRATTPPDPAQPGASPICKERIVSPIPTDVTPRSTGELRLEIRPESWFANVDFAQLDKVSDSPLLYRFSDAAGGQAEKSLYAGFHAAEGAYAFRWVE